MATVALHSRKLNFIQEFLKVEDLNVISTLEDFLHKSREKQLKKYFAKPLSKKEFNKLIDSAENDRKQGKVIKTEDLLKQIDNW